MPIGLFSGILIECTTWTTTKMRRAHTPHTKKRTKRIQFTTCTKSIRVVWNDCLSSFRYFTVDLFLVISIFVPHQFTFSLPRSLYRYCSLFFIPYFSISLFRSFAPHFTPLFHHINIFQSKRTLTPRTHAHSFIHKPLTLIESVWHWR